MFRTISYLGSLTGNINKVKSNKGSPYEIFLHMRSENELGYVAKFSDKIYTTKQSKIKFAGDLLFTDFKTQIKNENLFQFFGQFHNC